MPASFSLIARNMAMLLVLTFLCGATVAQQTPQPPALVATPTGRVAAGLNPPYLNDFPSADTVKRLIQGSDPTDTLARQVAAFTILQERIRRHIVTNKSGPLRGTPDEQKVSYVYSYAAWQIEDGYKKTHTAQEANAFTSAHYKYESDWQIEKEIDTKLLSASAAAGERASMKLLSEQMVEHNQAILRQTEEYKRRAAAAAADPHGRMVLSNDPDSVALRRCLELGGAQLECVGHTLSRGGLSLLGVDADVLLGTKHRAGLAIAGIYQGANGISLGFDETTVGIRGCGGLQTAGGGYTVTKRGTSYLIRVDQKPQPFTAVLGPDGNITGPGPTDVSGMVQVGEKHYTETTRRVSDWQIVGERDVAEPIYAGKTVRCNVGALRSIGPAVAGGMTNLFTTMFAALGNKSAQQSVKTYPAGVRMLGAYAGSGGLKITFALEGSVLDCGEAHVGRLYTVETTASATRVIIDNGGVPLALTLEPDGSLSGSGTVDVAGRLINGMAGSDVAYRTARASCPLGTLAPQSN